MKALTHRLVYALLPLIINALIIACGNDPEPSAQDQVKEKLTAGTWKLQDVIVDDVDRTSVYKNLTITFADDGTFATTNGGQVWRASDTWQFSDNDGKTITRGDNLPVQVDVTDTTLKLSLTWVTTTYGSGRMESVKGEHIFTFSR